MSKGAREFSRPKASAGITKDISRACSPPARAAGTALKINANLFTCAQFIPTDFAISSSSRIELSFSPNLDPQRTQCTPTTIKLKIKVRE
jgi:hypothetical protein